MHRRSFIVQQPDPIDAGVTGSIDHIRDSLEFDIVVRLHKRNALHADAVTSISGVTFIWGPDGPPPAIENSIEISPLRHACLMRIGHLDVALSSRS